MSNVSAVDQIAQAKAALEKQRAELMRINRDKASQRLAKDRQVSQAKSKADAPNIMGLFLGVRPPRKKTPAEVAAAGQGGSGSGKDAPAAMTVMCSVVKLAEKQIPGLNYRIIDERTIAIPSKSTADISAARKLMDDAKKLPTGTEASTQAIKDAADAMERASRFVDWITITDGEIVTIKTFEQAAANGIGMMQPVQLMGVDANYSVHKGVARSELQCAEPVPLNAKCPAYVSLCNMTDPQQIPMKLPDLSQNYGPTLLFYFADYMRDPSEADRGCVEFKILSNSIERKDYLITSQKKDVPTRSKHVYSMAQNQDGTHPDFPVKGMFGVQALFLEGDAKDTEKITLRRAFGINDPFTYAAIMSANNVPAIISGSVNMKECQKINPGRSHLTDIGTISIWGNSACFLLRQYLLMQCPQVSADWVYRRLKIRSAMGVSGPNVYAKARARVLYLFCTDTGKCTRLIPVNKKRRATIPWSAWNAATRKTSACSTETTCSLTSTLPQTRLSARRPSTWASSVEISRFLPFSFPSECFFCMCMRMCVCGEGAPGSLQSLVHWSWLPLLSGKELQCTSVAGCQGSFSHACGMYAQCETF